MDPKLKKAYSIWNKKLKASGFIDIEDEQGRLKEYSTTLLARKEFVLKQNGGWQAKQEYYRMASQFLHEYAFNNRVTEAIWEYHSNGISAREITKLLKKTFPKRKGLRKSSIWNIISALRKIMYKKYSV